MILGWGLDSESADRARVIAYLALSELHDLDPASEPNHFSRTRRDLAAWLDGEPQPPVQHRGPSEPPSHLRLVR